MISIIICSRNKDITPEMRNNIGDTIGADFEIVVIDNSKGEHGICSAYAMGTEMAAGDILCFVHDDVIFETKDWGKQVLKCFEDERLGVIGVAGTHFMPDTPSTWWEPNVSSINIIQEKGLASEYLTANDGIDSNVVALDGVFLCLRKDIFKEVEWDSSTFNGFHGYDYDICLQSIALGYDVRVTTKVLIRHMSSGNNYCESFIKAQEMVYDKWKNILPVVRGIEMTDSEILARTDLVKAKHLIIQRGNEIALRYRNSKEYKIGNLILHPWSVIKRRLSMLFHK